MGAQREVEGEEVSKQSLEAGIRSEPLVSFREGQAETIFEAGESGERAHALKC